MGLSLIRGLLGQSRGISRGTGALLASRWGRGKGAGPVSAGVCVTGEVTVLGFSTGG